MINVCPKKGEVKGLVSLQCENMSTGELYHKYYLYIQSPKTLSLLSNSLITMWFYTALPAFHINSFLHSYSKHIASTPIFSSCLCLFSSLRNFSVPQYLPKRQKCFIPAKTTLPAVFLTPNSSTSSGSLFNHLLSLAFPNSFHPGSSSLLEIYPGFLQPKKHSFAMKAKEIHC